MSETSPKVTRKRIQSAWSKADIGALRAQVTSKGGTTEAAIKVLEDGGVKEQFVAAVKAARDRSIEMGDALGKD